VFFYANYVRPGLYPCFNNTGVPGPRAVAIRTLSLSSFILFVVCLCRDANTPRHNQEYFGGLLLDRGCGVVVSAARDLTVPELSRAIGTVLCDPAIVDAAKAVGLELKEEDGVGSAIAFIEKAAASFPCVCYLFCRLTGLCVSNRRARATRGVGGGGGGGGTPPENSVTSSVITIKPSFTFPIERCSPALCACVPGTRGRCTARGSSATKRPGRGRRASTRPSSVPNRRRAGPQARLPQARLPRERLPAAERPSEGALGAIEGTTMTRLYLKTLLIASPLYDW